MVARVATLAFEGVEARPVDVQVQIASGNVAFMIVGLGDKAVAESRERVRSALIASGLALPARRITVNLAPADMPKEGSHYDLAIALGVMAAIGAIPADALQGYTVIGELALDGTVSAVAGVLLAAMAANGLGHGLICPAACGPEAAWASADLDILAPRSLIQQPIISRERRFSPARSQRCAPRGLRCLICATSRGRRAPSGRSKSQRRAGTIC
jgi:magnesium chelatase family protein